MASYIALLNTTIATGLPEAGEKTTYEIVKTTIEEAASLCKITGYESFVGHDATAAIFSTLLEDDVQCNRAPFNHAVGRIALCLKLRGRAPEGVILSREEVEEIGYDLYLMKRTA